MSNNKQSSVDFFAEKTFNLIELMKSRYVNQEEFLDGMLKVREQAKAMHRNEHGQTWDDSLDNLKARGMNEMRAYTDFDGYYNETFNNNEQH